MHNFPITTYNRYADLPLQQFEKMNFSVYILDFEWNYLFVNNFVKQNLGADRTIDIIGSNMWEYFPALKMDPFFSNFKTKMEKVRSFNGITVSPLTGKKLNVTGYALEDCYYCTSSLLPNKDELISDLRKQLSKK